MSKRFNKPRKQSRMNGKLTKAYINLCAEMARIHTDKFLTAVRNRFINRLIDKEKNGG